jgi:pilus assembly protein FimV
VPELSSSDELDGLSFESSGDNEEVSLDFESDLDVESNDLDLGDLNESSDDLEFSSLELDSADDTLPEFEENLSFDEEEMDLPELTDEISDDLDSELESLAGDDIELPTLETPTDDLNELPELDDDFDISVVTPTEELESVDEVAAEYKEELPSLDDAVDGDDFPPLGDIDDLDLDNLDSDLDFLSGTDESETKLDLARAYIDMEDQDGAREILQEVLEEGTDEQKQEATKLMDGLV